MTTQTQPKAQDNGKPADPLTEAIVHERAIEEEAAEIRGDATELTAELYLKLWPLLKRPIHKGLIVTTPAVKGKPYPSTGIKSMQVLIDRMNAVLTPLWWWYSVDYMGEGELAGTLAEVTVYVGTRGHADKPGHVLTMATSRGGVNQASTIGNRYKGSETNAAKRAFAQIGPGHEVYLGATDHDPDTDPDAAKQQEKDAKGGVAETPIGAERGGKLEEIVKKAKLSDHLTAKLRALGIKSLAEATEAQGMAVVEWVEEAKREQPAEVKPEVSNG